MSQIIPWRVDGPLPIAPIFGLLQAAAAPAAGVRFLNDVDTDGIERWMNGVEVFSYPPGLGDVQDACAPLGSDSHTKGFGPEDVERPDFGAMTVHYDLTCRDWKIWNHDEFKARAVAVLLAVEGATVAFEFMSGTRLPGQPYLADGNGTFPNLDAATSVPNGLALLEREIARTGRLGLIHCSPQLVTTFREHFAVDSKTGVIRTINGIPVIPDFGYADPTDPNGHAAAAGTEEWMYATGPIDIRRSEMFVMPESPAEALDRGVGATNNRAGDVTYRAERYYVVDWDTELQAAVKVDRCSTTC